MSNNEEQAREDWRHDARDLADSYRKVADRLDIAINGRDAAAIAEAVQDADAIGVQLFALRHGPEQPE